MKLTENMNSDFDQFLEDEGILAELINTSRSSLDRLLDYANPLMTLVTLESATHILGRKLNISIV